MSSATTVLEQLSEEDVDWLLGANEECHVAGGDEVISTGSPLDTIYLVLEGVLGVVDARGATVDVVGAGEIVGEMSFVERETPSRSVTALEASTLLVVPHDALRARAEADPAFGTRLYRSLAVLLSRRFRRAMGDLAASAAAEFQGELEGSAWDHLTTGMEHFKETLHAANQAAIKSGGEVPAEIADDVRAQVNQLCVVMEHAIGDAAEGSEQFKQQVGIRIQRELLPYLLLTKVSGRTYTKPRGYAGDYLTIELMYAAEPGGVEPLGPLLDACMLDIPPSVAVRNRRRLLAEEIGGVVDAGSGAVARVTSLACGPAREIFDVFEALPDAARLKATCIDFDLQALAYVADRRDRLGLQRSITLTAENLIHLAVGRKKTDLAEQDLVYSIGLIDYLPDELVVKLMTLIHSVLKPGGKAVLGNFHPTNSCKAFMDHILEWRLVHRDEADMNRLYRSSAFGRDCTNIRFEDQGINLFAECVKA